MSYELDAVFGRDESNWAEILDEAICDYFGDDSPQCTYFTSIEALRDTELTSYRIFDQWL